MFYYNRREIVQVESDDVRISQITYTTSGVTLLIYVLIDGDRVLDGDTLVSSIQVCVRVCETTLIEQCICAYTLTLIQNGEDIYMMYNFNSVTAEKLVTPADESSESGGLSTGAIVGIVIGALIVIISVVITAGFIL